MSIYTSVLGFIIILLAILIIFFGLEFITRIYNWFKRTFLIHQVSRKDFIADEYQDYLRRVEDWSKPMFYYFPIGLRLFNLDNPLPGKVENNSLGYRAPEFVPPEPGTKRIVLLGGSAAWSSGSSSNETTIAGYLEKMVNADDQLLNDFKKAEVFNLAQINGMQTQDILSLIFFYDKIQPDLVISFTGWNELVTSHTLNEELLEKFELFYIQEMEGWEPINVTGHKTVHFKKALKMWMYDKFEFAKLFKPASKLREQKAHMDFSAMVEKRHPIFKRHLKILNQISTSIGAKHIQFFQPYLYRKKYPTEQEQKIIHLYDDLRPVHGGSNMGDFLRHNNIFEPMMEELTTDPATYGEVHNLCDMFMNEKESKYFTLVHMTDSGYHDVAKQIVGYL